MPQLSIPRIRRHTFTPSPPSPELFTLVTKLSEKVGTKRAEFLIERLLDDQDAVVVSGWALALAWHEAHQLAAVDPSREVELFRMAALSCARWVDDVAMSTGEADTSVNVAPRLTAVQEAIHQLDRDERAAHRRGAARATQIKRERLAQLDRSVARLERNQEITLLEAIRRLFENGKIDDKWLPTNADDGKPKEWADLKRSEQRRATERLARRLAEYRRKLRASQRNEKSNTVR
jgi:hypothetical protein